MTNEEAKQFVEQIRREKREKDSPDLQAALKLLAEELNTKETHFTLELLQNAEDNEYGDKTPELCLDVGPDNPNGTPSAGGCLVVLNNEVGFQPANVRSLCSVGRWGGLHSHPFASTARPAGIDCGPAFQNRARNCNVSEEVEISASRRRTDDSRHWSASVRSAWFQRWRALLFRPQQNLCKAS